MITPIITKVILPSRNLVCDLEIHQERTFDGEVKRTYICLNKDLNKELEIADTDSLFTLYITAEKTRLTITVAAYEEFYSDLVQLSAEDSCLRGHEGRFTFPGVKPEDHRDWTGLEGFKVEVNGKDLNFSFSEDSVVQKKIQDQPMISPKLAGDLKKIEVAIQKDEILIGTPPAPEENPSPDEDGEETGGIGSILAYIFCFGWLADCWNYVFSPDPVQI